MRIIGIGQRAAGDDGVGLAVLDELARRHLPPDTELIPLRDPIELIPLLTSPEPLVLIDAVLGAPSGVVLALAPEELSKRATQPASSHGLGVARALELARALAPEHAAPPIRIVAITIAPPSAYCEGLSEEVARAVPQAADRVLGLFDLPSARVDLLGRRRMEHAGRPALGDGEDGSHETGQALLRLSAARADEVRERHDAGDFPRGRDHGDAPDL